MYTSLTDGHVVRFHVDWAGLPRYRSLEPATPEGEQIIIEPPAREDRMILPVDVDESLSPVGSSFAESASAAEAGLGENPAEVPAPSLSGRWADDLLRALFEEPLPDELSDAELDEGDDDFPEHRRRLFRAEIDTPLMDEIKEEEAGGEA